MKALMLLLVLFAGAGNMFAQDWVKRSVGEVMFEFPDSAREFTTPNGTALTYNEDDLYLTVTTIPDSTSYSPQTRLERSRYYAATAATVTINLRGKMVDNRDTMIGEEHLYYTAVEVTMPDSALSLYEILQYMPNDTLRAFTSQYILSDKKARKVRDRFFNSITLPGSRSAGSVAPIIFFVLGGAVIVFIIAYIGLRKNLLDR
jgi:hypothetical protein